MKILTFTTLYPNAASPSHGVFVEERIRHMAAVPGAALSVVAPVPWFPFKHAAFGKYSRFAAAPGAEERFGVPVSHPRYPVIPKIGMGVAPDLLARWAQRTAARAVDALGGADILDAHYFYPDGVAAAALAARLKIPFVVTARGADLNRIGRIAGPAKRILAAAEAAAAVITVSGSLKARLVEMGGDPAKIHVIPNGVDLRKFHPLADRETVRQGYFGRGASGALLVSVGQLIERKGHHLTIAALAQLPDCRLLIAGEGPERERLARLARRLGVADRVRFLGLLPHRDLPALYGAADVMVLASASEGMANVMLESLACGTPVVATPVDGALEIIRDPDHGALTRERSAAAIADAVRSVLQHAPDRSRVRSYAENYPWSKTAETQIALYRTLCGA